jgi:Na+/proline symporter
MLAALFWREANLKAATAAVAVGFVVWAWSSVHALVRQVVEPHRGDR